ncbi:MAG: sialate O-acetylesterase [Bacteroidota bacterium]|nr:sialate O-acetylesterase [Bacteroidota bacterium]
MKKIVCLFLLSLFIPRTKAQPSASTKQKTDLYLLAGQSNMSGRGALGGDDTVSVPGIWMLNKEGDWVPARDPLHFDKPKIVGVGPGFAFAKEMMSVQKPANIGLVPCAVGGTRIDTWVPGGYDEATHTHPYDDALIRIRKAMESGVFKGIIWHQGESDANPALIPGYEAKLRALISRFRQAIGNEKLPIVLGELGIFKEEQKETKGRINEIIRKVAMTTPYCGLAGSTGLTDRGDFTHFDESSAKTFGKRYADVMLTIIR